MSLPELVEELGRYRRLRAALGSPLIPDQDKLLDSFVELLASRCGPGCDTAAIALDWVCSARTLRRWRLSLSRGFLTYLQGVHPEVTVPGARVLGGYSRPLPYIYSATQLEELATGTSRHLRPSDALPPATLRMLIILLASCGIRIGEALKLPIADVRLDVDPPHLIVREAKFGKSRIVPVHPSVAGLLREFARRRRFWKRTRPFFAQANGDPLVLDQAHHECSGAC